MKPDRILMTADAIGGVWTYCLDLARALGEQEIEVLLAVMGSAPNASQIAAVRKLPNVRLEINVCPLEWMENPWVEVDAVGEWLLGLEDDFHPQLVHLNGYAHACLPWDAPIMVMAHSCISSWWKAVKKENVPAQYHEYRMRVREGLQCANLVAAPSAAMLQALKTEYGLLSNTCVIHNGRDSKNFRSGEKEDVIFSGGRLWDEAKNLRLVESIASKLPWKIILAGDISAQNLSGCSNIKFTGRLDDQSMADHLSRASIYAAPAFYEPFGLGILEAALSGCALVLSDIPSLRELWEGAALFVDPRDPELWISQLQRLCGQQKERQFLATLALERGRQYTVSAMAEGHLQAYEGLLVQAGQRGVLR